MGSNEEDGLLGNNFSIVILYSFLILSKAGWSKLQIKFFWLLFVFLTPSLVIEWWHHSVPCAKRIVSDPQGVSTWYVSPCLPYCAYMLGSRLSQTKAPLWELNIAVSAYTKQCTAMTHEGTITNWLRILLFYSWNSSIYI
jgi:hypothetical protein